MSDHRLGSSALKLNGKAPFTYGPPLSPSGSAWELLRREPDYHRDRQASTSRRLATIGPPSSVRSRPLRQGRRDVESLCSVQGIPDPEHVGALKTAAFNRPIPAPPIASGTVAIRTGVGVGLDSVRAGSNRKITSGYEEIESWIENQVKQLREGHIAVAVPKQMWVGKCERVEVGISTTGLYKLVAALHANPKLMIDRIHVGRFMEVTVTGEHFEVAPEGDAERLVLDDEPTIWTFSVQPQRWGRHVLRIKAFIRVKLPGNTEERRDLPVIDKIVRVRSSVPYLLSRLWKRHWRKLLAVGSILGGLITYVFSLDPVKQRVDEFLMMLLDHIKPLL